MLRVMSEAAEEEKEITVNMKSPDSPLSLSASLFQSLSTLILYFYITLTIIMSQLPTSLP